MSCSIYLNYNFNEPSMSHGCISTQIPDALARLQGVSHHFYDPCVSQQPSSSGHFDSYTISFHRTLLNSLGLIPISKHQLALLFLLEQFLPSGSPLPFILEIGFHFGSIIFKTPLRLSQCMCLNHLLFKDARFSEEIESKYIWQS